MSKLTLSILLLSAGVAGAVVGGVSLDQRPLELGGRRSACGTCTSTTSCANTINETAVALADDEAEQAEELFDIPEEEQPFWESAAAFLVVMMLFIPCAATIAVLRKEMNSNRWFYATLVMTLIVSYLGGMAAYNFIRWWGI